MKRKKVAFFCCTVLLIFCVLGAVYTPFFPAFYKQNAVGFPNNFVVVLDAGHGGIDSGVTGKVTGVKESDLNLSVTRLVGESLRSAGFTVLFTRSDQGGLYGEATQGFKKRDMYRRRDIIRAANAHAVISIHMNSCPSAPNRTGAQTFFYAKSEGSRRLGQALQTALNGINARSYAPLAGEYFLLTCSVAPTVIVECGFLSNAKEEVLLQTESHQKLIAQKIAQGIALFLGQTEDLN
ncbi:MAG: N-acetylmuramoyl-L-alanine amidase [Clostridiales bacterium]|nr:N-acetylmuramoyl-L-alanine amidase [Clostridiales bacterium]